MNSLLGKTGINKANGYEGKITMYAENLIGEDMVMLEGLDTTGRPISEWVGIERVEVKK